ncbi:MTEF4 factor, partial [Irena cyanogastra]|nr:MTEF4 factor [Irena cyanogastra]
RSGAGPAPPHGPAMVGRLVLRAAGRLLGPGWALPAALGPGLRRGCGELAALRAMGFSQEQARRLLALQPRLGPEHREAAAAQLLLLGLSAEAALALLERSPALLRLPTERLRERAEELRRLGLDGGRAASGAAGGGHR